jgi:hypothetical protein
MIRPFGLLRRIGTTVSDILEAIRGGKKIRYIVVGHRLQRIRLHVRVLTNTLPTSTISIKNLYRALAVPRRTQTIQVKKD